MKKTAFQAIFASIVAAWTVLIPSPSIANTQEITEIPEAVWSVHRLNSEDACNSTATQLPMIEKLTEHHTLYLIPCSVGFTNAIWRGYLSETQPLTPEVTPIVVKTWDPSRHLVVDTKELFNPEFEPETKNLFSSERAGEYGTVESTSQFDEALGYSTLEVLVVDQDEEKVVYHTEPKTSQGHDSASSYLE